MNCIIADDDKLSIKIVEEFEAYDGLRLCTVSSAVVVNMLNNSGEPASYFGYWDAWNVGIEFQL